MGRVSERFRNHLKHKLTYVRLFDKDVIRGPRYVQRNIMHRKYYAIPELQTAILRRSYAYTNKYRAFAQQAQVQDKLSLNHSLVIGITNHAENYAPLVK